MLRPPRSGERRAEILLLDSFAADTADSLIVLDDEAAELARRAGGGSAGYSSHLADVHERHARVVGNMVAELVRLGALEETSGHRGASPAY